jgi:2-polyprenyl-3-methyl-5-hydroxy-6-metoxy-1,4-benzoquinol methylase
VIGIDISFAVLSGGKKNAPRTLFFQADLRDLAMLRHESIDNAMACEVIEHLDNPSRFLKNLYPALKKGSHILITAPNYSRIKPILVPLGIIRSYGVNQGTSGEEYLHTAYTPDELAEMAKENEFVILEKGTFEYELRGWLKPLNLLEEAFNSLSRRFFSTSRLNQLFKKFMNHTEINAFEIINTLFLSWILKHIFKHGRRSYIVATK